MSNKGEGRATKSRKTKSGWMSSSMWLNRPRKTKS